VALKPCNWLPIFGTTHNQYRVILGRNGNWRLKTPPWAKRQFFGDGGRDCLPRRRISPATHDDCAAIKSDGQLTRSTQEVDQLVASWLSTAPALPVQTKAGSEGCIHNHCWLLKSTGAVIGYIHAAARGGPSVNFFTPHLICNIGKSCRRAASWLVP
jgi:hypothetical protein